MPGTFLGLFELYGESQIMVTEVSKHYFENQFKGKEIQLNFFPNFFFINFF